MNKYFRPLLAVIIFLIAQVVGGFLMLLVNTVENISSTAKGEALDPSLLAENGTGGSVATLAWSVILSNLIAAWLCYKPLRLVRMPDSIDVHKVDWKNSLWAIAGIVTGVLALNVLTDMLGLPDLMTDELEGMMKSPLGITAITLVAPIAEELVFRESLLGNLLRGKVHPWTALGISALLFGALHLNPAQILAAAGIGFLLGLVYWRTGNAVIPILMHILNNTFSVMLMWVMGDAAQGFSLVQWLGGTEWSVVVIICSTALSVFLFRCFFAHYPTPEDSLVETVQETEDSPENTSATESHE